MNALDKAFIQAYAKGTQGTNAPAVLERNAAEAERAAAAVQNHTALEAARLSPLVEVSAADGVWYRIEPAAGESPSKPSAPHFHPHQAGGNRVPPEAVRAAVEANLSAVEMLDSLLGLHTTDHATSAEEPRTSFVRLDNPEAHTERKASPAAPAASREAGVLAAHELEAYVAGAAASVVSHPWEAANGDCAELESLCQCWLASEEIAAPAILERSWIEAAPRPLAAPAPLVAPSATPNGEIPAPVALSSRLAPAEVPASESMASGASSPADSVVSQKRLPAHAMEPLATRPTLEAAAPVSARMASETASPTETAIETSPKPPADVRLPKSVAAPEVATPKAAPSAARVESPKPAPVEAPKQPPAKPRGEQPQAEPLKAPDTPPACEASQASQAAEPPRAPEAPLAPPKGEAPPAKPAAAFQAAWEVDRFNWPEECDKLSRGDAFGSLAKSLLETARQGKKVIAVTGVCRGEGRTTLALCVARRAAKEGARVVLVDADFERPHLGRRIGIDMENGWDDVLTDGQPLTEAAVSSVDDQLTVLPLGRRAAAVVSAHTVSTLQQAAEAFDLVLVDMGPAPDEDAAESPAEGPSSAAALVVCDRRHATERDLAQALDRLHNAGIETLGVIETFA